MKYHPWPGKTHNLSYFVPHLWLVTMNSAIGTKSLVFHKRTHITTLESVFCQSHTLRTETGFRAVPFFTVKANHQGDDSFFLFTLFINALFH